MFHVKLEIHLPFPISTNRIWRYTGQGAHRHGRGRHCYTSPEYSRWKKAADALYLTQKRDLPRIKFGKYSIHIILSSLIRRKTQDGDNLMKCVNDWLQRVEIIENDCLCEEWSGTWGDAPHGCRVIVTGEPLDSRK